MRNLVLAWLMAGCWTSSQSPPPATPASTTAPEPTAAEMADAMDEDAIGQAIEGNVGAAGTTTLGPPTGPNVALGSATAQGSLDKEIIRRYIRRNLPKITFCYEKQLLQEPQLQGTVTVDFVIAPDGTVSSSTGSGLHADVDGCVADVIGKIQFPQPQGGGNVSVRYPFQFAPAP